MALRDEIVFSIAFVLRLRIGKQLRRTLGLREEAERRSWPRRSWPTSSAAASASPRSRRHGRTARRGREPRIQIRQTGLEPELPAGGVRA